MDIASAARLLLLAAIWGGSFLFMRIGAPVFGAGLLAELRVGVAALFLWGVCHWLRRRLHVRAHWRLYLVIGLLNAARPGGGGAGAAGARARGRGRGAPAS